MLSIVMELCLLCKSLEEAEKLDDARDTRKELAEIMHDIMAEANSETDISEELFERHFQLSIIRKDIENKCFECLEACERKGGLIAKQVNAYLTSVLHAEEKLEIIDKLKKTNVVQLSSYLNRKKNAS